MSKHRFENLSVKDFDDAVKRVIDLLCESDSTAEGKTKAFIFRGWQVHVPSHGLGGFVLLRAIAKHLKSKICDDSDIRKHFGKIVHVDCSLWKNKRTMQRAIAEELNLRHVMPIFDKQDEDDDFRGVDDRSREEISSIGSLINESLRNEKFLMIFSYGRIGDIDLVGCGIPVFGKGKLLCTNDRRFQVSRDETMLIPSFSNISIGTYSIFTNSLVHHLHRILHEEAVVLSADIGMEGINAALVLGCFLYSLFLKAQLPENFIGFDYDWATHACNYWICDGIVVGDRAWEIGNALYAMIPQLSNFRYGDLASYLNERKKSYERWYSVRTNKLEADNISVVPDCASSYFLTFEGDDPVYVRNDLFQLASNLRVLKLCNCSFDFASPPFQSCHNLRFLWLDHCANTGKEQNGVPILPNLLVFDLRFTDYVLLPQMIELMTNLRELNTKGVSWKALSPVWKKLQNLHKLRVTESSDVVTADSCFPIDMMNLKLLDLSGNTHMESLPTLSSARSLKMLVLDGCSSLENVVLEGDLPLLESFSFDGHGPTNNWTHSIQLPQMKLRHKPPGALVLENGVLEEATPLLKYFHGYIPANNWKVSQEELRLKPPIVPVKMVKVTKISLQGCDRLQNIFLCALPNLEELDLSGTAIKTLDLLAMDIPKLKRLFLLGCQQLRSLIWNGTLPCLEMLLVDTQRKKRSMVCCSGQGSFDFHAFIAFTDGRFTFTFMEGVSQRIDKVLSILQNKRSLSKVYILISCMTHSQANITRSINEIGSSQVDLVPTSPLLPYNSVALAEDVACSSLVWNQGQVQTLDVHLEIGEGSYNLESMHDNEFFVVALENVQSLHVHDNSSITVIPPEGGAYWRNLLWCHVERCPKLHTLFSYQGKLEVGFESMRTLSACDLPMVYCIWGRGMSVGIMDMDNCFEQLQHIYLYNCPKLVFVLPISFSLPNLETLQIAYCSNLRHVFPLDDEHPPAIASGVTFKNLKHIKLYHLHKLEQICEVRLTTPALQMIGLRDCWGLRRLPAITRQDPKPVVDCEKDWWSKLEWDGLDAGHQPSLFETRHSAYYKKTLPRVSYLR